MCVCFVSWMLCIYVERCFESLVCGLVLFFCSLLVAFISLCFSSLWKTPFYQARQLLDRSSTDSYLSSPLDFFSRQILSHIRSIELSRLCLNSFSIDSRSIKKVSVCLIVVRSIEVSFPSIDSRQHLNRFWMFK